MLGGTPSSVGLLMVFVGSHLVNHMSHDPSQHKSETNAGIGSAFCDSEFGLSAQDQYYLQQSYIKCNKKKLVISRKKKC